MNPEVRIVLSGPGLIGARHAALLHENPQTRLAAIVAPDHPENMAFAQEAGVRLFTTLEKALASAPIDAAIVSSPNAFHHDQALACIESRLPVLVEKPLTESLDTAAAVMRAAEAHGVAVLVGHHRTYSPLLEAARDFIASDRFGAPVAVQGSALFYKPDEYYVSGAWRTRKGGGPILINMIHEVGILRHLYGEIDSVTARISRATRGFEVEDSAAVTLAFCNGAIGTFLLSDAGASNKSWEMTAGENAAYPHFPDQNCYHFAGTMGSLDFPSMRVRSYLDRSERSWWGPFDEGRIAVLRHDPLARQIGHFVDVVRGSAQPRVTARDGFLNMVVLEAISRAAETRREVSIREVMP